MKLLRLEGTIQKIKLKQNKRPSMSGKVENILLRIKYYFSSTLAQGFTGQVLRSADQAAGRFSMCIKLFIHLKSIFSTTGQL